MEETDKPASDAGPAERNPLLPGFAFGFALSIPFGLLLFDSVVLGVACAPLLSMIIGNLIAARRARLAAEAEAWRESETRH